MAELFCGFSKARQGISKSTPKANVLITTEPRSHSKPICIVHTKSLAVDTRCSKTLIGLFFCISCKDVMYFSNEHSFQERSASLNLFVNHSITHSHSLIFFAYNSIKQLHADIFFFFFFFFFILFFFFLVVFFVFSVVFFFFFCSFI